MTSAPEYLDEDGQVSHKTVVWSVGYFMYLLTGLKFAFQNLTGAKAVKASLNFHRILPTSKLKRAYPEEVSSLIISMLDRDPDRRPTLGTFGFIKTRY